jgi:hypothetical protein
MRFSLGIPSGFLMSIAYSRLSPQVLMLLSVACWLVQTLAPAALAAQQLDDKVVAAWKAYEQFAYSLQGSQHGVTTYIDRKDYVLSVRYRQNREGCLTIERR